jgi:signal transduction histidine kinase
MENAKAEAERTVAYLRAASIALLLIGFTITGLAMATIVRRSKRLEASNLGLQTEIAERRRAQELLINSREQLRALTAHLQTVREEERTRIAREIHDELGQLSTAMIIDLSWLESRLSAAGGGAASPLLIEKVKALVGLSETMLDTARRIATELRSGLLDDFGLVAAIEQRTQEFQNRTGIACDLILNLDEGDLDSASSAACYHIFQEALTNITRHAEASRVNIVVEALDGHIVLQVEDDGNGITDEMLNNTRSLGVVGMRERAVILGGEVEIGSVNGKGTRVTARIPKPGRAASKAALEAAA